MDDVRMTPKELAKHHKKVMEGMSKSDLEEYVFVQTVTLSIMGIMMPLPEIALQYLVKTALIDSGFSDEQLEAQKCRVEQIVDALEKIRRIDREKN